jgi:hypothetical protein
MAYKFIGLDSGALLAELFAAVLLFLGAAAGGETVVGRGALLEAIVGRNGIGGGRGALLELGKDGGT